MILRSMGEAATGIAVHDSCYMAVNEVLLDLGLDPEALTYKDGSGLSRMNNVSPAWMVSYLQAMQGSPAFDAFLASLPAPGEGTLSGMLSQAPLKGRIRMKSGSMEGVLCYSGYILDSAGKPQTTFSLMTNNTLATQNEVRAVLSRLLTLLLE